MHAHKLILLPTIAVAAALAAGLGGSAAEKGGGLLGFELRESKEELKLTYDLAVQDNGGGRMNVTFTLADEGRIKPLSGVDLAVPSSDRSGCFDVVLSLAPFERDGKKVYVLNLTRDLVERGELNLKTQTMDGKQMVDWRYHRVPFAAAVKAMDKAAAEKKGDAAPPAGDAAEGR